MTIQLRGTKYEVRANYNLGERIFRLVCCFGILVPVGVKVRAKTRRPNPKHLTLTRIRTLTPTPNRTQNGPKRAKTGHKRGCASFASHQEISELRTTIPKCSPHNAIFYQVAVYILVFAFSSPHVCYLRPSLRPPSCLLLYAVCTSYEIPGIIIINNSRNSDPGVTKQGSPPPRPHYRSVRTYLHFYRY